jgi:hypothetical protein
VQYTGKLLCRNEVLSCRARSGPNSVPQRVWNTTGRFLEECCQRELENVANTNILKLGGRLLALWEGGRPYEPDPVTLETLDHPFVKDETTGESKEAEWGPFENLGQPEVAFRGVTFDEGGDIDTKLNFGRSFTAHPHVILDRDSGTKTLVGIKAALNPI